jgi:hypothetical protein
MYEKGGMTKERLLEFLEKNVFGKYKDFLIYLHFVPINSFFASEFCPILNLQGCKTNYNNKHINSYTYIKDCLSTISTTNS